MADYRAWQGLGEALSGGVDSYAKAKAAKVASLAAQEAKDRQSRLDTNADSDRVNKDYQFEQEMKLKRDQLKQAGDLARLKSPIIGGETPGRKAADQAMGKDYVEYNLTGRPAVERGIGALGEARATLQDHGSQLTGLKGRLPDFIRSMNIPIIDPHGGEAVDTKEKIRNAVQGTLKATLGAQFTEKEGERIFNQAYNASLTPEQNISRLDKIITELEGQRDAKEKTGQYFEQKGTLTGYQGGGSSPQHQSLAKQILSDPEASPEDRAWAQTHAGQ